MMWLYACRILLLAPLAVWLFAMFTLSRFTFGAKDLLVTAAKLALGHLPSALVVALIAEEAAVASKEALFTPILVLPALAALLCSLFMEKLFAPYLPKEESDPEEETPEN